MLLKTDAKHKTPPDGPAFTDLPGVFIYLLFPISLPEVLIRYIRFRLSPFPPYPYDVHTDRAA